MALNLFFIGLALSQFLIFASGLPQPAHFLFAISICVFLLSRLSISVPKSNKWPLVFLFCFVVYQFAVNFIHYVLSFYSGFIWQAIYILFGFAVFILIYNFFASNSGFLRKFAILGVVSIFILFLTPIFGLGRYNFFPRFNAFFNDPNQMAYWVLCVAAICITYFTNKRYYLLSLLVFMISSFLIFIALSRSGLVGLAAMFAGFVIILIGDLAKNASAKKFLSFLLVLFLLVFISLYLVRADVEKFNLIIERFFATDFEEEVDIRGYGRFFEHPEFLIFGAGHGNELRFTPAGTEIHSTWAGLLFYYGVVGFLLFSGFIASILRKLSFGECFVFLAPLFYSFFTFGLRTPIFWIFLGFFYVYILEKNRIKLESRRLEVSSDRSVLGGSVLNFK